ncbi:hypothetical protein PPACK8108_LOCUS24807 [Phakopsora pachyrhizi]|uniref:Uncharacterized protein n=1 Tax=Phakopsora pachyrhizi TaxID=170000 RepID=A0AAV0BSC6_PHAPC|nr:hypothetical protein PPACK8108_LOCUS24807 [Phakopsora pachyrhizi]
MNEDEDIGMFWDLKPANRNQRDNNDQSTAPSTTHRYSYTVELGLNVKVSEKEDRKITEYLEEEEEEEEEGEEEEEEEENNHHAVWMKHLLKQPSTSNSTAGTRVKACWSDPTN